jgi:hypothetical protein
MNVLTSVLWYRTLVALEDIFAPSIPIAYSKLTTNSPRGLVGCSSDRYARFTERVLRGDGAA